jgi:hypothetical protein
VSTSEHARPRPLLRAVASLASAALLIAAVVHCGAPDRCLRFSDCSVGFTCAAGACVPEGTSEEPPTLIATSAEASAEAAARVDAAAPSAIVDAAADREASVVDADAEAVDAGDPIDDTADF